MSEAGLWKYLRSHVVGVDWVRVENPVFPGTPDVNYAIDETDRATEGWAELKWVPRFPKKETKPVFGPKKGLSVQQVRWINRRTSYGARVWIIAGVGKLIYVLDGWTYANRFNAMTTADFQEVSPAYVLERRGDAHFQIRLIRILLEATRRPFAFARSDTRLELPYTRAGACARSTRTFRRRA